MKIIEFNTTHQGSTGNIMLNIARCARADGLEVTTFSTNSWGKGKKNQKLPRIEGHKYYGSFYESFLHNLFGKVFAKNGGFERFATARVLREFDKIKPDVIHLHNLHGFNVNLPMLFKYIKKKKIRVIWTLHDCWSFTGQCPHYAMIGCERWKTHCHDCPLIGEYPKVWWDNSSKIYDWKRKMFNGVEDLTIVTPSKWLAEQVAQSYLKNYPVNVINNGINLDVFAPTESDFRTKYGCEDKHVVLGVSSVWNAKKGLDVFIELASRLDKNKYQIVLVGTDEATDAKLPDNVISIHRTENQAQLAEIYSAADVFVNPTREDTFPTVNIESLACGTPVVTFRTGGSPEILTEECGSVVDINDTGAMEREIARVCEDKTYREESCVNRARNFDMKDRFEEYVELYRNSTEG